MKPYRIPRLSTSSKRLTLTLIALLSAAPFSLEAQGKPREYWATTAQVKVRCPDGHIAGVVDRGTKVRVVDADNEGRVMDSCTEHSIAAQSLRPKELVFWKLDERWRKGLDVDGIHYNAGAAFQVLTINHATRTLTIIGPRGIPESLTITADLADEEFFNLNWDVENNAAYCPTPESAGPVVAFFLRFFAYVTTPQGALPVSLLLLFVPVLNAFDRRGFEWQWLLVIPVSAFFFYMSAWSYLEYEKGLRACEAQRASLSRRVTSNGFILPTKDARWIQPQPIKDFDGQLVSLTREEYLESHAYEFFFFLPLYFSLFVRGGIMCYLTANSEQPQEEPAYDQDAQEGELPSVVPQEEIAVLYEAPEMPRRRWFLRTARRVVALTNLHTEEVRAANRNLKAQIKFLKLRDEAEHIEFALATYQIYREVDRKKAKTGKRIETANRKAAILEGKKKNTSLKADLAEEEQRLHRVKNPLPPEDDATRYRRELQQDFNEHHGRVQAAWDIAQQEEDKMRARNGGELSEDDERELQNYHDWAQRRADLW